MAEVRIVAEPRTEFGKGFARRVRRDGRVPAVLYGHGTDPRHVAVSARELMHAFKGASGTNVLLTLELPDGSELALPRQVQKDPIRGDLLHVDLLLVKQGERVAVDVPVHTVGESIGVKTENGILDLLLTSLHVEAEATHIPAGVEVDVTDLGVGDHITAGQVKLPSGVTLLTDPDAYVVNIMGPTAEEPETVAAEGEGAEGEAAAEGAEDAPAEGGTESEGE